MIDLPGEELCFSPFFVKFPGLAEFQAEIFVKWVIETPVPSTKWLGGNVSFAVILVRNGEFSFGTR